MLWNLYVKNLALIHESEIAFGPGLNILTGETGAGKSMIIGSVNLAMGGRAPKGLVREGAESALVELTFHTDEEEVRDLMRQMDLDDASGEIIITRKITAAGRSVCRVNGETVSLSALKTLTSHLIDVHGQHSHESLRTAGNHRTFLDAYAGEDLKPLLTDMKDLYHTWQEQKKILQENSINREEQLREISFLEFEIREIEEASLTPGEDETLEKEYRRLSHSQKTAESYAAVNGWCASGEGSASEQIGRALRELLEASRYSEEASEFADRLSEISSLLDDFNMDLSSAMEETEDSGQALAEAEKRLNEINRLKEKYGHTIADILALREEKIRRLEQLNHYEEYLEQLRKDLGQTEEKLYACAERISAVRKKKAAVFEQAVCKVMKELNFAHVEFSVAFSRLEEPAAHGIDGIRFLISTNPGEPVRPLDQVASGGELSRIMLAVKTVLARKDHTGTLIFDEIDSGISGRTAQCVAEKLRETARHHQLICITHLPQIAAMADTHFLIEKSTDAGRTVSEVRALDREDSIRELARMLGGAEITDTVRDNAREMKEMAENIL